MKLVLSVLLAIVLLLIWGLSSAEDAEEMGMPSHSSSAVIEGAGVLPERALPGPTALSKLERKDVTLDLATIQVMNWRGRAVRYGKLYFCNDSEFKRLPLDKGSAVNPEFDWTHVLISIQNHAPYLVDREMVSVDGGVGTVTMPAPTFQAQIVSEERALDDVVFSVPFPWLNEEDWPLPLRQNFRSPFALPLYVDSLEQSVYYVGPTGSSTTVTCPDGLLMETEGGLRSSNQYPPNSTQEVLVLHRLPVLTLSLEAENGHKEELDCKVTVELRGVGVGWKKVTGTVDGMDDGEWSLPFHPSYNQAFVVISDQKDGLQLGSAVVDLHGVDQHEVIELSQSEVSISVLDQARKGIPGALIVQAKETLGVTDANGVAVVSLSKDAGRVWVLAAGFDASGSAPDDFLTDSEVRLGAATGIAISCRSVEQAALLADAGGVQIVGLKFSFVLLEAPKQVKQVYGLSMKSSASSSAWGVRSAVFRVKPMGPQLAELRIAGIFEIQEQTEAELIFSDVFQQRVWSDSLSVLPNEVASTAFFLEEVLQTISVRVLDDKRSPIEGAHVSTGPWAGFESLNPTDSEGRVSFAASTVTDFLLIEHPNFVSRKVVWPLPFPDDVISLARGRDLRLQVVDQAGTRIDVNPVLTDGTTSWFGIKWAVGIYQFKSVPKRRLNVEIQDGGATLAFEVPPDVGTFTLTHTP